MGFLNLPTSLIGFRSCLNQLEHSVAFAVLFEHAYYVVKYLYQSIPVLCVVTRSLLLPQVTKITVLLLHSHTIPIYVFSTNSGK